MRPATITIRTFETWPQFLLSERKRLNPGMDFAPSTGKCYRCKYDLVKHYGIKYPQADITGCPSCNRSYCD